MKRNRHYPVAGNSTDDDGSANTSTCSDSHDTTDGHRMQVLRKLLSKFPEEKLMRDQTVRVQASKFIMSLQQRKICTMSDRALWTAFINCHLRVDSPLYHQTMNMLLPTMANVLSVSHTTARQSSDCITELTTLFETLLIKPLVISINRDAHGIYAHPRIRCAHAESDLNTVLVAQELVRRQESLYVAYELTHAESLPYYRQRLEFTVHLFLYALACIQGLQSEAGDSSSSGGSSGSSGSRYSSTVDLVDSAPVQQDVDIQNACSVFLDSWMRVLTDLAQRCGPSLPYGIPGLIHACSSDGPQRLTKAANIMRAIILPHASGQCTICAWPRMPLDYSTILASSSSHSRSADAAATTTRATTISKGNGDDDDDDDSDDDTSRTAPISQVQLIFRRMRLSLKDMEREANTQATNALFADFMARPIDTTAAFDPTRLLHNASYDSSAELTLPHHHDNT